MHNARREWLCVLGTLLALVAIQLYFVPPGNFGGLDEWLDVELISRGIVAVPFAYRPLGLLAGLPAAPLFPHFGFAVFRGLYGVYAVLSGALTFGLVKRLLPGRASLALLAAGLVVAWAPRDMAHLSNLDSALYQGITLLNLLAVALLVEAWHRNSPPLLGAGVLTAFLAIRCYEGGTILLLAAPLLLLLTQPRSRRLWTWIAAWEAVVGLAAAFVLLEVSVSARESAYQLSVLGGVDSDALGWLGRVFRQYAFHLWPVVASSPRELLEPGVGLAVAVLLCGLAGLGHGSSEARQRRPLVLAGLAGLVLAGLAYSLVLVGWRAPTAYRIQFLSAPGIALFLASAAHLLGSLGRGRERLLTALLGAWIVAVGTGRTLAMQEEWTRLSMRPRQFHMLSQLARAVPDVVPHTLLIALDDAGAWAGSFSFHHAVQYLYERRAAGFVPRRADTLYQASLAPDGIRFEPWVIVRRAWDAPTTVFGYDEIVVVRHAVSGGIEVLDRWPADLKPLPPGARYEPRGRIRPGSMTRASILER